jgi:general secretion pathway protein A
MLQRPELRQLNQRVTARYNLEPLSRGETGAYIRHRLQVAGLGPGTELFPPRVVRAIHRHSRGIPRLINLLCDRMLLGAYGQEAPRVDRHMLRKALHEVTGEMPSPGDGRALRYAALALAGLALVVLAWWALLRGPGEEPAVAAPAAAPAAAGAGVTELPRQADAASALEAAGAAPAAPVADTTPVAAPAPAPPAWLLPPDGALRGLYALQGGTPVPADPCRGDLRCEAGRADTWQDLAPLARPLLLELVTPDRFAAAALLLELGERTATLATPGGVTAVPLADLADYWGGGYRYLWDAPAGFGSGLAVGDEGPAVAAVAGRFARLDGQLQPLTGERFTPRLAERVRLFQRAEGLAEDGIVGTQTLRRLNFAAGLVPPPAARAAAWEALLAAGFRP